MKKNPVARAVRTSRFKLQIVGSRKGKGSYSRRHNKNLISQ